MAPPPYSLLLKSSKSTFFLLLPATSTFSTVQSSLITQIQSNKPHLPASITSSELSSPKSIILGIPKEPTDPTKGFAALDSGTYKDGKGTLAAAGIKDGAVLAFVVVDDEDEREGWSGEFDVEWPVDDYQDSQSQGLK